MSPRLAVILQPPPRANFVVAVTLNSSSLGSPGGTARYELLRLLGKGATGEVYLALDRESGEELALKKLLRLNPRNVQRFKREFRMIANMHHPNLVKLYDLQHASDVWFLTMEYVDGLDLHGALVTRDALATLDRRRATFSKAGAALDAEHISKVARTFHQLALGVRALHEAGLLHCDLKPSNVVVAKTGRIVVLDFGLVRGLSAPTNDVALEGSVAGTPAYMAPEQALGQPLSEASDWYAFGVVLYEVLSGLLPIDGSTAQLLQRKLETDPKPLRRDVAPRALAELCMRLLMRDPADRPAVDEILAVLLNWSDGSWTSEPTHTEERLRQTELPAPTVRVPLYGRAAELLQLRAAFASLRDHPSLVVHVRGPSGSGKSSLLEHFLQDIEPLAMPNAQAPVVLRSRCYEREAIPFKALDGVIDALANHLSQLDDVAVAHLLPTEMVPLVQVFPVLERLRAVQSLMVVSQKSRGDVAQVRRRAEQGLRELMTNVARDRPLVVWIDDLQWGDLDSASLLADWLQRPTEAPVLLLLSYRSEEIATSTCLVALLTPPGDPAAASVPRLEVHLAPLPDADVEALCLQRLGAGRAQFAAHVERIVREAQGDPFLASQLCALALAKFERGEVDLDELTVEELVMRTSALLSAAARDLLNVLALAGRPLVPQFALSAADIQRDGRSHIHALQALRLVRTRDVGGVRLLEVYHDRVRQAVQGSLIESHRARIYDHLLRVVATGGRSDPGWLHQLAIGAGQRTLALRYGTLAAEIASSSLAFERAAELYASCLTLTDAPGDLAGLSTKYALALVRCRRGVQAAEAYLRASQHVSVHEQVPLLQLAASHFVRSGRYEEGEQLVLRVFEALGVEVPKTQGGFYAAIAWERARTAWLSSAWRPRPRSAPHPDAMRRGEFFGVLSIETQSYAPLRAALFQVRSLRIAYEHGESGMLARALCLTATLTCLSGTAAAAKRTAEQLDRAAQLCQQIDNSSLRIELLSARAVCALLLGRMADVIETSSAADQIYETKSSGGEQGDYYYMFAVRTVRIGALQNLGRHNEAAAELSELLANAHATDNRTAVLQATLVTTSFEQVLDRCKSSRARLDRERAELPRGGTAILHVLHMASVLRTACMTGEYDWALGVVEQFWQGYQASPVHRSAYLAFLLRSNRARMLLNRHVALASEQSTEALIQADLRWLSNKAPTPFRAPSRARLCGRLAYLRGDRAAAIAQFRSSAAQHAEIGAQDEAARERWALGCVLDDAEGQQLKAAALLALVALGIREPAEELRGYYPELSPVATLLSTSPHP